MNLVTLENVSKQYSERQLLDGVSLLINEGDRVGLIGVNGSGKTTLLRLVAGIEQPDAGAITVWGGVRIRYLPQEPRLEGEETILDYLFAADAPQLRLLRDYRQAAARLAEDPHSIQRQERLAVLADEMDRTGGWAAEAKAKALLSRLGIDDFQAYVSTLSGGQAKRVALARILIGRADLLILDEPTNHIDAETVDWLESYLADEPGALLMVTHDRYFLDRVVNRIVELDRRKLVNYPGNYSRYLEQRTRRHEQLAAAEEKRRNLLRRELEWLRRGAMARSTKQKARKQRIEALQQISYDRGEERVAMALAGRRLGKKVLEAWGLSKRYGEQQLFRDLDFSLMPGDRIGIIGPNGAGKTTLLNILSELTPADSGTVIWGKTVHLAYYDQLSRHLEDGKKVIEFIDDKAPLIQTDEGRRVDAAQMLEWFLFPRRQQQAYIGSLSGGERRRLYLLWVLIHQPNVLFLDEPTNDLDVQTLAVLEQFLDHFQGCLVVVSHDRYFLDRNVDYLMAFEDGAFTPRHPAPFSNFQRWRREMATQEKAPHEQAPRPEDATPRKRTGPPGEKGPEDRPRKLSWKEARELERIEARIADLEVEKDRLSAAVNEAGGDYQLLGELAQQLQNLEEELERTLTRWLELSEVEA